MVVILWYIYIDLFVCFLVQSDVMSVDIHRMEQVRGHLQNMLRMTGDAIPSESLVIIIAVYHVLCWPSQIESQTKDNYSACNGSFIQFFQYGIYFNSSLLSLWFILFFAADILKWRMKVHAIVDLYSE